MNDSRHRLTIAAAGLALVCGLLLVSAPATAAPGVGGCAALEATHPSSTASSHLRATPDACRPVP